ncbi:MAG: hypothetical protein H6582_01120 [Crocinitomicaceae bacterium]|nr:hypothetical protein [Crocinitomicaceae bacterium]
MANFSQTLYFITVMAIAKKGFRKIVVNGLPFHWKFNEKIIIAGGENGNGLLTVDFGWYDIWLYVNDQENEPPPYEPKRVTPEFVKKCIVFALSKEWKPDQSSSVFNVFYQNGQFSTEKRNTT